MSALTAVLSGVLASNFVFARGFGVGMSIIAASSRQKLLRICAVVTYFSCMSSLCIWVVRHFFGLGVETEILPLMYVTVISVIYLLSLFFCVLFFRKRFVSIRKYIHISAFNSLVMGTAYLVSSGRNDAGEFMIFGLSAGLGFTLASVMLSAVYPLLSSEKVPKAFRGYPAVMIFIGVISMAMVGILGAAPSYR
ncbi:MAG: hypothetical protein IJ251_01015 [Oscillospiraceae bacterium]|nr:hypothetical protein [Oscillospiraceae bacterium]